ncbi:MAG: hypothetical protein VZR64_00265 [Eubacterium sp.]|nr:hypothetical protein [Eubacterium sp.]
MKGKYLIAYFLGVILFLVIFFTLNLDDQEETTKESTTTSTTATTMTETTTDITTTEVTTTTTEAVTTTTTMTTAIVLDSNFKEPDYVLFDWESRTVHDKNCPYINMEAAQKIYGYENGFFIDEGRPCSKCNPIVTIGHVYIPDESYLELTDLNEITYYGDYDYRPVKGASGRELITHFSAASSVIPLGTYVYVRSDNGVIDACYRIDDTGCDHNVIDLYYETYDLVQPELKRDGRISANIWIIKDPE